MPKRQHHKGRKRPRSWHRSKSSARHFDRRLQRMLEVYQKAEADAA